MRHYGLIPLAAAAILVTSCSAVDPFYGKPRRTEEPSPAETQAEIVTLLSFDVTAPKARSSLLRAYCEATEIPLTEDGDELRAGPFLSQFEAALLAGWVPGGSIATHDVYPDPATTEPWIQTRGGDAARIPSHVGTRRLVAERFALVTFEGDQGLKEVELHQTTAQGPRFLMKLPQTPSLEVSGGLMAARAGDEISFLQVMNLRKDKAIKAERLAVWRFDARGRTVLRDEPFLELRLPEQGDPELLVTRIQSEGARAKFIHYRATFKRTAAAETVSLTLNDWSNEAWKDKPQPDLLTFEKAEKVSEANTSLE